VLESPTRWGGGTANPNKFGTPVRHPRKLPETQALKEMKIMRLKIGDHRDLIRNLIVVPLFLLSLFVRLEALDVFITPDELKWTCRSINFYRALQQGDFAQTFQKGHPGVITMWIGVPAMGVDPTAEWLEVCRIPSTTVMMESAPQDFFANLASLLFAGRRAVALFTSLSLVGIYLLTRKLLGQKIAILATLLIAFDPFFLAHSRFLHLDAVTTSLMTLSLLSLLVCLEQKQARGYLIFSGVMAGWAAINKSPAAFLAPFSILLIVVIGLRKRWRLPRIARLGAIWGLTAGLAGFLVWPALWVNPWGTIRQVLDMAIFHTTHPHTNFNYFWGNPCPDPGPAFYPVATLFRLTPWSVVGLLLAVAAMFRSFRQDRGGNPRYGGSQRFPLLTFWVYALLFMTFMAAGQKKFDRYLLPIFPVLDIIAAVGFAKLIDWLAVGVASLIKLEQLSPWKQSTISSGVLALTSLGLLVLPAVFVRPYAPYYLPYYNPLLGGTKRATEVLLVGWDEGLDEAARYMNAASLTTDAASLTKENVKDLRVAVAALPSFVPFYEGPSVDLSDYDPATIDYVILYLNEVQRQLHPDVIARYYDQQEPEYTVRINGIDYAWIYRNTNYVAPMRYVAERARPETDAILVSTPSLFSKHYAGDLPLHVLQQDAASLTKSDLIEQLEQVANDVERIWYVKYPPEDPDPNLAFVDHQLDSNLYKSARRSFPDIEVTLYHVFGRPSFGLIPVQRPLNLAFGQDLRLRGYGVADEPAQWGQEWEVVLQWEALRDLERHYAAFLHLVDDAGYIWGQGDKWLMSESLVPTAGWRAGDVVVDRYGISLLKGTSPGRYKLRIGLYDRINGGRLEIRDSDGTLLGDSYDLGMVEVKSSPLALSPEDLEIPHPLERDLAGQVKLLGYDLDKEEVGFGEQFTLALYWQALRKMEGDYSLVVRLREGNRTWAEGKFLLGGEHHLAWQEGEVLWDRYYLKVDAEAPRAEGILEIDLLDAEEESVLEKPVALAKMNIQGRRFTPPEISHPMKVNLGEAASLTKVNFLGYDLETEEAASLTPLCLRNTPLRLRKAGDTIHLTLYWQANAEMKTSYTVFTHLLGDAASLTDKLWGQKDGIPMGGRHPTTQWQEGEVIVDEHDIIVEGEIPEGTYHLEVGMYDLDTRERLPVFEEGMRLEGDKILLDSEIRAVD
jgi:hypothetical protein